MSMTTLRETSCEEQRTLDDNRCAADMVATLRRQERQLAELNTTNKMQSADIESLKKRLEYFGSENDDLLEKLAEMKRDRARRERQFDAEVTQVADKLRQVENRQEPQQYDINQLRETKEQLEAARRNAAQLRQELDAEQRRYVELERSQEELKSRLEGVQLQLTEKSPTAQYMRREQYQLKYQVRALTKELNEARQRLTNQANSNGQVKQELERLRREKIRTEEQNHELSSEMHHLKHNNAISEQREEKLRMQLDELSRTMKASNIREEDLRKQLQRVTKQSLEVEQRLEQMRVEQNDVSQTKKMLRNELERMKEVEIESGVREAELKQQIADDHKTFGSLSRKMQMEIDCLKEESKRLKEEVNQVKQVNVQLANNECKVKVELEEARAEVESRRRHYQQNIDTLRSDLQASKETCIKLRKERDTMQEKWVPKVRLEEVKIELKQMGDAKEKCDMRLRKLQDEKDALHQNAQKKEEELCDEMEKLCTELKTKDKQLEEAAEKSTESEKKNEQIKQSYEDKQKLSKREHEKLEHALREQLNAFQEEMTAKEAQHLVEKEHMSKLWSEREKELKNKMKSIKMEIRAEVDNTKSKYEQLEVVCEKKMKEMNEETKRRIKKLKEEVEERNKLLEEANEKNRDMKKIVDEHVSQSSELNILRSANDDLKAKVGKLERAVLRLRLDNDELREHKAHTRKNENSEQSLCMSDPQRQSEILRLAVEDQSKASLQVSVRDVSRDM